MANGKVHLQVGRRTFVTTNDTLVGESGYFAALLSSRWSNSEEQGSYYIEADPDLFEHILRYLRRGVFPIFYDNTKGHDYALYLALLEEAKYYQIQRLVNWLKKKRYLRALKVERKAYDMNEVRELHVTKSAEYEMGYFPAWTTKRVYICPKGVASHRGDRHTCRKKCRKLRGDVDAYEEEQVLQTLVVEKRTVFDSRVSLSNSSEDEFVHPDDACNVL